MEEATHEGSVIVVPLLIGPSKYYSQAYIPEKLEGLNYTYNGKALLPDKNIARWIELTASRHIRILTPILIYDRDNLLEIGIEDVGKYHGDVCPCVAIEIRVNEEVFPEGFFELRKKCKTGIATPEEMKEFRLAREELKEAFMYLPIIEVFGYHS